MLDCWHGGNIGDEGRPWPSKRKLRLVLMTTDTPIILIFPPRPRYA
jgi:hypothetical protein